MWRIVTRGIRESWACRKTNALSFGSRDGDSARGEIAEANGEPRRDILKFTECNNGFYGSAKSRGAKDKRHGSYWNASHTWTEAVGWSSVLAVGWAVCQSLCFSRFHRRLYEKDASGTWCERMCLVRRASFSHLFGQILSLHPLHVLRVTNCVGNSTEKGKTKNPEGWEEAKSYGPVTVEEALREAGDEFTQMHKVVMGEYELLFGVKALEEKRYTDAVKHFTTGAKLSSTASMFNLGLCHELGLGTLVDDGKAAKYYRNAADKGHANAMYNLGVFHAQGRGGVALDVNAAHSLFAKAAKLGQRDAQYALSLEQSHNSGTKLPSRAPNRPAVNNIEYCSKDSDESIRSSESENASLASQQYASQILKDNHDEIERETFPRSFFNGPSLFGSNTMRKFKNHTMVRTLETALTF